MFSKVLFFFFQGLFKLGIIWQRDKVSELFPYRKHQTHYEQVGELSGKIDIEGYPSQKVHLIGVRDHTFGFRNWEMFHRYAVHYIWVPEVNVWLSYLSLKGKKTFREEEKISVTSIFSFVPLSILKSASLR